MNTSQIAKTAQNITQQRNKLSDYEVLEEYYYGDHGGAMKLTEHQTEVNQRWRRAYGLWITEGKSITDIVDILAEDFPISEYQAQRDVKNALKLFASEEESLNKKILRSQTRARIKRTYDRADKEGNVKVMAQCDANFIKVDGLDREEIDLPFDKMELLPAVTILDSASRAFVELLMKAVMESGNINLMNLSKQSGININDIADKLAETAETAEFETILETSDNDTESLI